jgi:8-oxo-dGTP pyrophosphatase MutT (NUDIX family)
MEQESLPSDGSYALAVQKAQFEPGTPVDFRFRVLGPDGQAVSDYRLLHERELHLIVVRLDGGEPRVLLVTSKRNPKRWIFPKGHIEKGETAEAAALREAREEAGIVSKPVGPAGVLEFKFLGTGVRVEYVAGTTGRRCDAGRVG